MSTTTVVSKRTSNRRLLRLATFLESLPPQRFRYSSWVGEDWDGKQNIAEPSCGTSACALGWATAVPNFYKAGLRMKKSEDGPGYVKLLRSRNPGYNPVTGSFISTVDVSINAAQKVFGLEELEARFLFIPDAELGDKFAPTGNATAKTVAQHIRNFVASR